MKIYLDELKNSSSNKDMYYAKNKKNTEKSKQKIELVFSPFLPKSNVKNNTSNICKQLLSKIFLKMTLCKNSVTKILKTFPLNIQPNFNTNSEYFTSSK